mmetsp:Transcript_1081/g.2485  ORF Transcript_1081/g.2485 Transcript_1081/m.2485 type:complete len:222 (-) Transcript_1081:206-871(-)
MTVEDGAGKVFQIEDPNLGAVGSHDDGAGGRATIRLGWRNDFEVQDLVVVAHDGAAQQERVIDEGQVVLRIDSDRKFCRRPLCQGGVVEDQSHVSTSIFSEGLRPRLFQRLDQLGCLSRNDLRLPFPQAPLATRRYDSDLTFAGEFWRYDHHAFDLFVQRNRPDASVGHIILGWRRSGRFIFVTSALVFLLLLSLCVVAFWFGFDGCYYDSPEIEDSVTAC